MTTGRPRAYYNEIEPYAAQWLRNLIGAGLIADGDVDERSIDDVRPDDVAGYTQCHFFAGIGGWSYALRLAGWSDDRPVWTGSPPCQDHSVAGSIWAVRRGLAGPRGRLAEPWLALIARCRPCALYFENVPGIAPALAAIEGGLAGTGYRVSRAQCASGAAGAPHLRRRVWIAAYRDGARRQESWTLGPRPADGDPRRTAPGDVWVASPRTAGRLDDGLPCRVARVRAFGNAIDPWVAAAFIRDSHAHAGDCQ
jgi:DNA (cytosine-5)-methyltransferase 1